MSILGALVARGAQSTPPAKSEYAEFDRLIQQIAMKQIPKLIVDTSGWGYTVPLDPKLRLAGLRTTVKVKDRLELPHGLWRKIFVSVKDPERDINIHVRDFKIVDAKLCRIKLDADAAFQSAVETQQWQRGLPLFGFTGEADARIGLALDCDVALGLDTSKFPPELKIDPKVTGLKVDLKDFTLRKVALRRLGTIIEGPQAKELGDQYKGFLQEAVHAFEPMLKDMANDAIARGIRESKGAMSTDAMLKVLSAPKEKK
jgi:hypothetical protein